MNNEFYKPQILECPACGATLAIPDDDIFECDYCGKRIIVPSELRPQKRISETRKLTGYDTASEIHPWQETSPSAINQSLQQRRKKFSILLAAIFVIFFIGLVSFVLAIIPMSRSSYTYQPGEVELRTTPLPTLVQFARLKMVFGSEGDQVGQFDDPRSIAVDPIGNIFVADYSTGRINKFDAQGTSLQLIQLPPTQEADHIYTFNMDTDGEGNLYVAANGNIYKLDTSTGEVLLTIPDQWPDIYFESVNIAPDGNLYSTNGMAGADELIILSPQGDVLDRWENIIYAVNHDDPGMDLSLAINNSGVVYILSPFASHVYVYNPDGSFQSSFGQEGDQAGQLSLSTDILATTPQDHLLIGEAYRVDLFDRQGNYLVKTFTIDYDLSDGSMRDVAVDSQGNLFFISSGGKVLKFEMNYP